MQVTRMWVLKNKVSGKYSHDWNNGKRSKVPILYESRRRARDEIHYVMNEKLKFTSNWMAVPVWVTVEDDA